MKDFKQIPHDNQVEVVRIDPMRGEELDQGIFVVRVGTLSIPGVHVFQDFNGQIRLLLPHSILGLCDEGLRASIVKKVLSAWGKGLKGVV